MEKVQVLLSTYNGERFVTEQLESLLQQDYQNVEILIRDDGSKDQTNTILSDFESKYSNITVIRGKNIGVKRSFLELIKSADQDAGYFVFCDQDDYWEPEKISSAVKMMGKENQEIPVMYFSKLKIVDQQLNLIRESPDPEMGTGFENAIIQNVATGCTMGINRAMVDLLNTALPEPDTMVMHDAWIYLVASAFGKIVYDSKGHILYRQHESNTVGMTTNKFSGLYSRYEHFKVERKTKPYTAQATEFYHRFGTQLSDEKKELLHAYLFSRKNMATRWKFLRETNLFRQTTLDTRLYKFCYLNNWY